MKPFFAVLAAGLIASASTFAAVPATAPAGTTGMCKDGSFTAHESKKGACSGHKGVKEWYAGAEPATPTAANAAAPIAAAATKPAPTASHSTHGATTTASKAPAAGGGAGQVWVNSDSKVYHCAGTKYYGKTKQGEYMSESAAKAAGNHADHGKACS